MESARFDGFVRSFGRSRSRRQTLRGFAAVAAGTSALALNVGARAQDATPASSPEVASPELPLGPEIAWMPEWKVKSGTYEDVRALLEEMEASSRSEAGALSYALYLRAPGNRDHRRRRVVERVDQRKSGKAARSRSWVTTKLAARNR